MVEDISDEEFQTVVVEKPRGSSGDRRQSNDSNHHTDQPGNSSTPSSTSTQRLRLLIASSRARNVAIFPQSVVKEVILTVYKYESSTFDSILSE